jgi:hypothetical protein
MIGSRGIPACSMHHVLLFPDSVQQPQHTPHHEHLGALFGAQPQQTSREFSYSRYITALGAAMDTSSDQMVAIFSALYIYIVRFIGSTSQSHRPHNQHKP